MKTKPILCPGRLRHVPRQFSWIDQRLVRDRHIQGRSPEALVLYLLLCTVADAQGRCELLLRRVRRQTPRVVIHTAARGACGTHRRRTHRPPGPLHLTCRADLLDLELPSADLTPYDTI